MKPYRPSSGEICRLNKWTAGTVLVGDEGYGPTVIKLTAVGKESVLAETLSHNGDTNWARGESCWTLEFRDWKKIKKPSPGRR